MGLLIISANLLKAYEKRASFYFNQKKYDKAIEDYNEAIKLKPSANSYYFRGACKDILNKRKEACEDLQKAADLGHTEAKQKAFKICN